MSFLKRSFENSVTDVTKLQEYVWFSLCFHFGRRGHAGWCELEKGHLASMTDPENKCYVTMVVTEKTKSNAEGSKQSEQDYSDVRIYKIKDIPLDPVHCFEIYLSKLNPENSCLFPKPNKSFSINNVWYTNEVLGKKHTFW